MEAGKPHDRRAADDRYRIFVNHAGIVVATEIGTWFATVEPMEFDDVTSGLNEMLGVEFIEVTDQGAVARLEIDDRHRQPYGIVHGGTYTTLIEAAASLPAAMWAAGQGIGGTVGINNNTDFIKAIRHGVLIATAEPVHRGRTQQLWIVEVTDEAEGKLRARGQVRLQNIANPESVGSGGN